MTARTRPPAVLIAGGRMNKDFGTAPWLGRAFAHGGTRKPVVLHCGAAMGDDRMFGAATIAILKLSGAGEVLWPRVAGRKKDVAGFRKGLERADVVYVNGGDVEEGMKLLAELDLVEPIRAAARRGAAFTGISAGAIMIGARWVRWPREDAGDDEADTFECLGIVPVTVDTHGEKDSWGELKSFVAVRSRETARPEVAYGIPSGAALEVDSEGEVRSLGSPAAIARGKGGKTEKLGALALAPAT